MKTTSENVLFDNLNRRVKNQSLNPFDQKIQPNSSVPFFFKEDLSWLEKVMRFMHNNFSDNYYTIQSLACDVAISERQLRRKFKKLLGCTPAQYFRAIRLQKAHQLLSQKEFKTVTQVAYAVGYKDVGTFRENYFKTYGEPATECLFR